MRTLYESLLDDDEVDHLSDKLDAAVISQCFYSHSGAKNFIKYSNGKITLLNQATYTKNISIKELFPEVKEIDCRSNEVDQVNILDLDLYKNALNIYIKTWDKTLDKPIKNISYCDTVIIYSGYGQSVRHLSWDIQFDKPNSPNSTLILLFTCDPHTIKDLKSNCEELNVCGTYNVAGRVEKALKEKTGDSYNNIKKEAINLDNFPDIKKIIYNSKKSAWIAPEES